MSPISSRCYSLPRKAERQKGHGLEALERYIEDYDRAKVLLGRGLSVAEISHAIGWGLRTVPKRHEIALEFHPDPAPAVRVEG